MKLSRSQVRCKAGNFQRVEFEEQQLSSFGGLVLLRTFFSSLGLISTLRSLFRQKEKGSAYPLHKLVLLLIVHLLLGFRRFRDAQTYRHDPILCHIVGLKRIPDTSTWLRQLAKVDKETLENFWAFISNMVISKLARRKFPRITLDFDGSVLSTKRRAEDSAVGFNKAKKGGRSYYPLLCTVAQTGQVFDCLHRPGNVHDSNGAFEFIRICMERVRQKASKAKLEARMDSAFYCEGLVYLLLDMGAEFSISVPFEKFPGLKEQIEGITQWSRENNGCSFAELSWKPKSWSEHPVRFIVQRKRQKKQIKGPLQLDLFEPRDFEFTYSVLVSNKKGHCRLVAGFHQGRGSQESIFGELKTQLQMDYIPSKRLIVNRLFMAAAVLAHNLLHEWQMQWKPRRAKRDNRTRAPHWEFLSAYTIRDRYLRRAARITRPKNVSTVTISAAKGIAKEFRVIAEIMNRAA